MVMYIYNTLLHVHFKPIPQFHCWRGHGSSEIGNYFSKSTTTTLFNRARSIIPMILYEVDFSLDIRIQGVRLLRLVVRHIVIINGRICWVIHIVDSGSPKRKWGRWRWNHPLLLLLLLLWSWMLQSHSLRLLLVCIHTHSHCRNGTLVVIKRCPGLRIIAEANVPRMMPILL